VRCNILYRWAAAPVTGAAGKLFLFGTGTQTLAGKVLVLCPVRVIGFTSYATFELSRFSLLTFIGARRSRHGADRSAG
jgi:hypothetical protein